MEINVGDVFTGTFYTTVIVVRVDKFEIVFRPLGASPEFLLTTPRCDFLKALPNKDNKMSSPLWKALHGQENKVL